MKLSNVQKRRDFIKASVVIGMLTTAPVMAASTPGSKNLISNLREKTLTNSSNLNFQYLTKVLKKYTATSTAVSNTEIDEFVYRFIQINGKLDYKSEFSGLNGEFRLAKLLIKSYHAGQHDKLG